MTLTITCDSCNKELELVSENSEIEKELISVELETSIRHVFCATHECK